MNTEVEKKLADIERSPQHFAEVLSHGRIHFSASPAANTDLSEHLYNCGYSCGLFVNVPMIYRHSGSLAESSPSFPTCTL